MRNKFLMILILSALLLFGCQAKDEQKHELTFYEYFDTVIEISYYKDNVDEAKVKEVIEGRIKEYHNKLSNYEGGAIFNLNKDRSMSYSSIIPLVKQVLEWEDKTGYALDISKGRLFGLWKDAIESEELPSEEQVKEAMKMGGKDTIEIKGDVITLKDGAEMDLGAVCKGYLNDVLKEDFKNLGIINYVISAGGNVTVHGRPSSKRNKFSIGIENPFEIGKPFDIIYTNDKSLVTSGDYQRFAEIDGKVYHHLIDLNTGYPADNNKRSITIVGDNAFLCDFLSTTLFLKSDDEIKECLKDFPGYEYFIIYKDGSHFVSDGLKKSTDSFGGTSN